MGNGTPLNNRSKRSPVKLNINRRRGDSSTSAAPATARARREARAASSARKENSIPMDVGGRGEGNLPYNGVHRRQDPGQRAALLHRTVRLGFDVPLLLIICTLVIVGMVMLHSASWKFSLDEFNDPSVVFMRQLSWLALALVAGFILSLVNYHHWQKFAIPLMVVTMVGLFGVLLIQDERHGAVRTLSGGSIQPSELAKLAIIIYLSVWLFNRRDQLRDVWLALFPLGVILGLVGGLIAAQPDLSAVVTIMILGGMLFFLAGGDLRQILVLMALGFLVGWLVVRVDIFPTGSDRISSFIAGLRDPLQASDHVQRSLESFVKGSWFGSGIGRGSTKLTILPFPHTDSIFAVVGEETGVLGSSILVTLYGLLTWRGLVIAKRAPDQLGALLAAGLTYWIVVEAFINMAVMVSLLPFAGNALPFVSAGGSNRLVSLAAIGIILNISRLSEKSIEEENIIREVVDLRRRNWRRSVSSPRRPSKTGVGR